jgi:DinB superfamily
MTYNIQKSIEILERTPAALTAMLSGLSEEWIMVNEGPETFSPYDVIGHLLNGEKTDWPVRARIILEYGETKTFDLWDRFAQYKQSRGKTLKQLLEEFAILRNENMNWLKSQDLTEADLDKKGMHPKLGEVSLRNLMATWVVHDLTHTAQVARVMAKQYAGEMGPWTEYFRILSF